MEPLKKATIKLKEENEFSPVSRRRGGVSEYLEPFPKVVDVFTKSKVCRR